MKALKITCSHGRIWVAETSSGVRAQSSTLQGVLEQLLPASEVGVETAPGFESFGKLLSGPVLERIFEAIPDSGDGGIARKGQVSG